MKDGIGFLKKRSDYIQIESEISVYTFDITI